jgi:hypothetical protein
MAQKNMNQQDSNRKINPDNIPPKGDDPKNKKPRFSIYWVYGIVFLTIIAWNLFRTVSSAGIETDQQKFTQMVLQGDVAKMKTIRNKKIVRVFINTDSLKAKTDYYKRVLNLKPDDKNYETAVAVKADQPQLFSALLMIKPLPPKWPIFIKSIRWYKKYPTAPKTKAKFLPRSSAPYFPF